MSDRLLPFRATTATGDTLDIDYPLHPDTLSPMRVSQLTSALLETLDREIGLLGETGNGDVLQALSLTLAIRAAIIAAPQALTDQLARDLVARALEAAGGARRSSPMSGHA